MPNPARRRREPSSRRPQRPLANPFSSLLSAVKRDVDARLERVLDERRKAARAFGPELGSMIDALSDLCRRGGKRLRPALLVAGCRAVSPRYDAELALSAGVALELVQAYFLIHDDWMDGDRMRRGGPSVHALLEARFSDPHRAESSAILAGDYAAALGLEILSRSALPKAAASAIISTFARLQLDAVVGQHLDLFGEASDPEAIYALKTGSYTVRGPLELGAQLAGAKPETLKALSRFARPAGIAFQLRDDLLGAFGDPALTGKPLGNDLRAGKRTPLLLSALSLSKPRERAAIERVLGNSRVRELDLRRALSVIEASGARDRIEQRIRELAEEARRALGKGLSADGVELLTGAVAILTERPL
jgi:geranylgeranyl diphosphate synthase, type I